MQPFIIVNWKMHFTLNEADSFAESLANYSFSKYLIIAAPTPYIAYLATRYPLLNFCAQDVSIKGGFGAYTGENSAKFFKSFGVNYAIIGHSERRNLCAETNSTTKIKAQNCIEENITPIICIGESAEIREKENYQEFLLNQLSECLPSSADNVIIAYEPIWAIGTRQALDIDKISEIIQLINIKLQSIVAKSVLVVYGGSVHSGIYEDIARIGGISGVLIGSSSLNKEELFKILNS